MKRILLPLICLMLFINVHSQVKEITIKNNDLKITEKLSVLKSDKKIRQGSYEKYLYISKLNKNTLIEKGQYDNNKKVGNWTYYEITGDISLQYCFDNDSILIYNGLHVDGLKKDRPLLYLGSRFEINHICMLGIKIPSEGFMLGQSGEVKVEIKVSENGDVTEYSVTKGVNKVLDNEALRVAKLIPQSWLPMITNGEHVKFSCILPVKFMFLGVMNVIDELTFLN